MFPVATGSGGPSGLRTAPPVLAREKPAARVEFCKSRGCQIAQLSVLYSEVAINTSQQGAPIMHVSSQPQSVSTSRAPRLQLQKLQESERLDGPRCRRAQKVVHCRRESAGLFLALSASRTQIIPFALRADLTSAMSLFNSTIPVSSARSIFRFTSLTSLIRSSCLPSIRSCLLSI